MKKSEFPVDVFHPALQEIIKNTSDFYQVSDSLVSSYMLNIIGFSLSNKYECTVKGDWLTRPNIWTLFVGDSGSGKSPLFRGLTAPVRKCKGRQFEIYKQKMAEHVAYSKSIKKGGSLHEVDSGEEIRAWFLKKFGPDNFGQMDKPTRIKPVIESSTFEKINKILSVDFNNGRSLLIKYDEFLGFMLSINQFSKGPSEQTLLKMWEYEGIQVDRMDEENSWDVEDQTISIAATTQPHALHEIITRDHIRSGLPYRFFFEFEDSVESMKIVFNFDPNNEDPLLEYRKMVDGFLLGYEYEPNRISLQLTPEIKRFLHDWNVDTADVHGLEDDGIEKQEYVAIMGKMHGYITRVAIILNRQRKYFEDDLQNITFDLIDFENAKRVLDHYVKNTVKLLNLVQWDRNKHFRTPGEPEFFDNLADNFKHNEFVQNYMTHFKSSRKTGERRLKEWHEIAKILKKGKGFYYKSL